MPKQKQVNTGASTKKMSVARPQRKTTRSRRKEGNIAYARVEKLINKAVGRLLLKFQQLEEKVNNMLFKASSVSSGEQQDLLFPNLAPQPEVASSSGIVNPIQYFTVQNFNLEKPKFPFRGKHPVTFIEDLTVYLRKVSVGANVIDIIIECLEGEARNWARIYKDRWMVFEDFRKDFLDNFWGQSKQNQLRRQIVQGRWEGGVVTMLAHFVSLCGQAKMLSYPMPEQQLVNDIMNQYPRDVQYAWSVSNYSSILEATEFLRRLDDINEQNYQENSTNHHNQAEAGARVNAIKRRFEKAYKDNFIRGSNHSTVVVNAVEFSGVPETSTTESAVNLN